jgi:hypothetical protein
MTPWDVAMCKKWMGFDPFAPARAAVDSPAPSRADVVRAVVLVAVVAVAAVVAFPAPRVRTAPAVPAQRRRAFVPAADSRAIGGPVRGPDAGAIPARIGGCRHVT